VLSPVLFTIYTDVISSAADNVKLIKFPDDTVVLGLITHPLTDNQAYFNEVGRLAILCDSNDLLLNPTKTHEIIFTTQRKELIVPKLCLNNVLIEQSHSVKYLGVTLDTKLRFQSHICNVVTKARQRMYIVKRFSSLGANSRLVTNLFKSFVEPILFYCIVVFYPHLYSNEKKEIRKIFKIAVRYGATVNRDIDALVEERTRQYILGIYHDDVHFIHNVLDKLPSGRLRSHKVRSAVGRDNFYTFFIKFINDAFF
jgi:hypothetical protein